ncbi:retrovirus-related pol polyprotein from transposon TNT 1-94 [Tanacetum coccineum]
MSTSATHNAIMEAGGKDHAPMLIARTNKIHPPQPARRGLETYSSVDPEKQKLIDVEAEAVHIILTGIDNDIYSTVDACANAKEMWLTIKCLMQGENINKQDVKTNLFWAFGKFTSRDGESLESYYSRFYKLMNELVGNKWLARNVNPLALVAATQHQPDYYPLPKPNYNPPPSTTRSQAVTQSKGKDITRAPSPTPELEHEVTGQYENHRAVNVAGNRDTVGNQIVQQTRIQCYNCKGFGHTAMECRSQQKGSRILPTTKT